MGKSIYDTQCISYIYKNEDDKDLWWYWCRFYLYKKRSLCILMSDHDGDRFISGIEKIVLPEKFPTMFIERFSSFDYYDITKNNSIPFDEKYMDIMEGFNNDYNYVGEFADSTFTLRGWKLGPLVDYFKPLIDYFEDNSVLWECNNS